MLSLSGCVSSTLVDSGGTDAVSQSSEAEQSSADASASSIGTQAYLQALAADAASIPTDELPAYSGEASIALNGDVPFLDAHDALPYGCEYYSKLDFLGRCKAACAIVGEETMPAQKRGSIGDIRPSGWRIAKYDWIEGGYLYNRCHLIGYQLTGQNANECNLITGTRYLNVDGMQPYEDGMADYVRRTGNHVLYRVTPVFKGVELVARGVVMEALSVEDEGSGLRFCRWCPNVQPGVTIDYLTGISKRDEEHPVVSGGDAPAAGAQASESADNAAADTQAEDSEVARDEQATDDFDPTVDYDYILNKNSHLVHRPDCPKVADMKGHNKRGFVGTRDEVLALAEAEDYRLCRYCNP